MCGYSTNPRFCDFAMAKNRNEDSSHDNGDDHEFGKEPNFDDPPGFKDDVSDEGA